jgi:hypothetical protein
MRKGFHLTTVKGNGVLMVDIDTVLERKLKTEKVDLGKYRWFKKSRISKSVASQAKIPAPYSMKKLLDLMTVDEYHFGCIDAISKNTVKRFDCKNEQVMAWWKACQAPPKFNKIDLLRQSIKYDNACGNGFLIKLRNLRGEWVGLQRLLPNETEILENYNDMGFLVPDYIQRRGTKMTFFAGKDVIHLMEETHKSQAWGLKSLPIAANIEILKELKTLDYNNFKNGLFIDYLILVDGLLDIDTDNSDDTNEGGFAAIKAQFETAIQNKKQHSSIILESGDPNVKIRVEKLRKDMTADGQKQLEEKYRNGIFAYHTTPPRIMSTETPGKLGSDNNSDLKLWYFNKIQPGQQQLASILADEFNAEFGWGVEAEDFDFGNLLEDYVTDEERFFTDAQNN